MYNLLILLEQISGQFGNIFVFCLWEHFQYKQQFYIHHERFQYFPCALLTDSKWDSSGFNNTFSVYSRNTDDLYPCLSDAEDIMTLPTNFYQSFHQHPTLFLCRCDVQMCSRVIISTCTGGRHSWKLQKQLVKWTLSPQIHKCFEYMF